MVSFLFTMLLLSLVKGETANSLVHSLMKVEELKVEEVPNFFGSAPYPTHLRGLLAESIIPQNCSDVEPPDSTITCQEIKEAGLCKVISPQFCTWTCRCSNFAPEAVCKIISKNGLCEDALSKGYCMRECDSACINLTETCALMSFRASMSHPYQLVTWNGHDVCNGWAGVVCKDGHVSELRLGDDYYDFNNNKWGYVNRQILRNADTSIPSVLSYLKHLRGLWLSDAGFTGTLPVELSELKNLTGIDVMNYQLQQQLTGTIPPEYSVWNKMQVFRLRHNSFSGSLPVQYSTWKFLFYIDVAENKFTGSLPAQFSTWLSQRSFRNLQCYFGISDNQLSGIIPVQFSALRTAYCSSKRFCDQYDNKIHLCQPPSLQFSTGCPTC